jgi:DNA primase
MFKLHYRRFQRTRLPNPTDYYATHNIHFKNHGDWQTALCPFHDDHHPSLRIHRASGAFRCMVCGARGGDVLAFHRLKYGVGFKQAAQALGAWEGHR